MISADWASQIRVLLEQVIEVAGQAAHASLRQEGELVICKPSGVKQETPVAEVAKQLRPMGQLKLQQASSLQIGHTPPPTEVGGATTMFPNGFQIPTGMIFC